MKRRIDIYPSLVVLLIVGLCAAVYLRGRTPMPPSPRTLCWVEATPEGWRIYPASAPSADAVPAGDVRILSVGEVRSGR